MGSQRLTEPRIEETSEPSEFTFDAITFGDGRVSVYYRLPNGVRATVNWDWDAHDIEVLKRLMAEYEGKVREKVSGHGQNFQPSTPAFEAD